MSVLYPCKICFTKCPPSVGHVALVMVDAARLNFNKLPALRKACDTLICRMSPRPHPTVSVAVPASVFIGLTAILDTNKSNSRRHSRGAAPAADHGMHPASATQSTSLQWLKPKMNTATMLSPNHCNNSVASALHHASCVEQ